MKTDREMLEQVIATLNDLHLSEADEDGLHDAIDDLHDVVMDHLDATSWRVVDDLNSTA